MDHEAFDRLTRSFGSTGTRRSAFGALLGAGLSGTIGLAAAKKHRHTRTNRKQAKNRARVSAEAADCLSPGHGSDISGCDYTNADFSGQDLSSSRMVATIFRNAELVGTDLSSSNARSANFRDANLCGADLSSSTLRNANFRDANLTLADLHSSACGGATFTAGTVFCGTIDCDGDLRNDDCPGGPPPGFCCTDADCPSGATCADNACVLCGGDCSATECCDDGTCASRGTWGQCEATGGACEACATGEVCVSDSLSCAACAAQTGGTVCNARTNPERQCGIAGSSLECRCVERAGGAGSVCYDTTAVTCDLDRICDTDADCVADYGEQFPLCIISGEGCLVSNCGPRVCAGPC